MVSLIYPKDGCDRFLFFRNAVLGPGSITKFALDAEMIPFRSKLEAIEEERGIFGENQVIHDKLEGDLLYSPLSAGAIAAYNAQFPLRVNLPLWSNRYDYQGVKDSAVSLAAEYGLAVDGTVGYKNTSLLDMTYHQAYWVDKASGCWNLIEFSVLRSSPTRAINAYHYIIDGIGGHSSGLQTTYWREAKLYDASGSGTSPGFNMYNRQLSWGEWTTLKAAMDSQKRWDPFVSKSGGNWYYRSRTSYTKTPTQARELIDTLVAQALPSDFPIVDKHYGELAMEASEKVNRNNVNMIAFLRDLRKPQELIPKLNQLRKLKGLSNNYLTVEYGILPTISDLKTIVRAFRMIKPYFDKNGFSTYNAVHTDSKKVGSMTYNLEQRIKLAIDKEDDEFEALLSRLESFGVLPTLENAWDLVPYSFVIDWFVDVGGLLERVDSYSRIQRLNIRYVTFSRKVSAKGTLPPKPGAAVVGTFNWERYHRWVSDQCPVPPLTLQTTIQDFSHWLESGALLVQRTK